MCLLVIDVILMYLFADTSHYDIISRQIVFELFVDLIFFTQVCTEVADFTDDKSLQLKYIKHMMSRKRVKSTSFGFV